MGYVALVAAFILIAVALNGGLGQSVSRRIEYPELLTAIREDNVKACLLYTSRETLNAMQAGDNILVFPENAENHAPGEGGYAREGVGQLYTGFAMIAPMYYAKTHKRAVFVPIYASRKHRTLTIGQGVVYDPDNNATAEKLRIVDALLDSMQAMYEQEAVNESPTSHPSTC